MRAELGVEVGGAVGLGVREADRVAELVGRDSLILLRARVVRIDRLPVQDGPALGDDRGAVLAEFGARDAEDAIGADAEEVLHDAAVRVEDDEDAAAVELADDVRHVLERRVRKTHPREVAHDRRTERRRRDRRPVGEAFLDDAPADRVVQHDRRRRVRRIVLDHGEVALVVVHRDGSRPVGVRGARVRIDDERTAGPNERRGEGEHRGERGMASGLTSEHCASSPSRPTAPRPPAGRGRRRPGR